MGFVLGPKVSTGHAKYRSHIGLLEALAALHAVAAYGPKLKDSVVVLRVDNLGDCDHQPPVDPQQGRAHRAA
jgi:hypothetical protein